MDPMTSLVRAQDTKRKKSVGEMVRETPERVLEALRALAADPKELVLSPLRDAATTFFSAPEGQRMGDASYLYSKVGSMPGVADPGQIITRENTASVTPREDWNRAAANTAINSLAGMLPGGTVAKRAAVGGAMGAYYDPENPIAGAVTGAGLGELLHQTIKRGGPPGLTIEDVSGKTPEVPGPRRSNVAASNISDVTLANLFEGVTPEEALRLAQQGAHLKQNPNTGQYVGGPPGMDSPQKLAATRRSADARVQAGASNADWYGRRREGIGEAAGFEPGTTPLESPEANKANLMSRGTASYSPQASPLSELQWFLKQHMGHTVDGVQLQPRFLQQSDNLANAYRYNAKTGTFELTPEAIELANKTGGYSDAGNPTIDPKKLFRTANDQWHARVMGFVQPDGSDWTAGLSDAQHGYLTGENLLLAERAKRDGVLVDGKPFDWDPRSAQAATWGAARFDKAFAEQAERIAKYEKKDKAYQRDLAKWEANKQAGKQVGPKPSAPAKPTIYTEQELWDYANEGTDNAIKQQTAAINQEYAPGPDAFLPGFSALPKEAQNAYAKQQMDVWGPRNPILTGLDQFQRPITQTQGVWKDPVSGEMQYNLGDVSRPIVSTEPTPTGRFNKEGEEIKSGQRLTDQSKRLMETTSAIEGVTRGQYGTGMAKFTPANSSFTGAEKTGAFIDGPKEQLAKAKDALTSAGFDVVEDASTGGLHVGRFAPEGNTWNSEPGVKVDWPDKQGVPLDGTDVQRRMRKALASAASDLEMTPGRLESGFEGVPWGDEGAGDVSRYLERRLGQVFEAPARLDAAGVPDVLGRRFQTAEQFAGQQGLTPFRPDVAKLYDLLRGDKGGGFQNFLEYVKRNGYQGLPAAALTTGGGAILSQMAQDANRRRRER